MKFDGVFANIKKITSNPNTISFVIVIIMVLIIYVAYSKLIDMATKPQDVPFATRTLKEREQITSDKISIVQLSGNFVNLQGSNLISKRYQVIDKYVDEGYTIPQGSLFYNEAVTTEAIATKTYYADLPDGYTAFALDVDFHKTYGCSIMPGDYIDIFFTGQDDQGKLIFGLFIKSIKVLQVLDADGLDVFTSTSDDQQFQPKQLMFGVPDSYFELLNKAVRLGFQLVPVPRNDTYSEKHEQTVVASQSIMDFVLSKTDLKDSNSN